jgi:hypothetical protein
MEYAYPDGLSGEDARPLWMEEAPRRTVVAAFEHREHGYVGLPVMFLDLVEG